MDNLKHANQLKKENERAQGKIKLLIKSCKQLEEEKGNIGELPELTYGD